MLCALRLLQGFRVLRGDVHLAKDMSGTMLTECPMFFCRQGALETNQDNSSSELQLMSAQARLGQFVASHAAPQRGRVVPGRAGPAVQDLDTRMCQTSGAAS